MQAVIVRILSSIFTKEKIVSFGAGVAIMIGAGLLGMNPKDLKESLCKAEIQVESK